MSFDTLNTFETVCVETLFRNSVSPFVWFVNTLHCILLCVIMQCLLRAQVKNDIQNKPI